MGRTASRCRGSRKAGVKRKPRRDPQDYQTDGTVGGVLVAPGKLPRPHTLPFLSHFCLSFLARLGRDSPSCRRIAMPKKKYSPPPGRGIGDPRCRDSDAVMQQCKQHSAAQQRSDCCRCQRHQYLLCQKRKEKKKETNLAHTNRLMLANLPSNYSLSTRKLALRPPPSRRHRPRPNPMEHPGKHRLPSARNEPGRGLTRPGPGTAEPAMDPALHSRPSAEGAKKKAMESCPSNLLPP